MTPDEIDTAYTKLDLLSKDLNNYLNESNPRDAHERLRHMREKYAYIENIMLHTLFPEHVKNPTFIQNRIYRNACVCQIEASKDIQRLCRFLGKDCEPFPIQSYCSLLMGMSMKMLSFAKLRLFFYILPEEYRRIEFWRTFDVSEEILVSLRRSLYEYQNIKIEVGVKRRIHALETEYHKEEIFPCISIVLKNMYDLTETFNVCRLDDTADVSELSRIMQYKRPVEPTFDDEVYSGANEHWRDPASVRVPTSITQFF